MNAEQQFAKVLYDALNKSNSEIWLGDFGVGDYVVVDGHVDFVAFARVVLKSLPGMRDDN
jgi:hypothetical protein